MTVTNTGMMTDSKICWTPWLVTQRSIGNAAFEKFLEILAVIATTPATAYGDKQKPDLVRFLHALIQRNSRTVIWRDTPAARELKLRSGANGVHKQLQPFLRLVLGSLCTDRLKISVNPSTFTTNSREETKSDGSFVTVGGVEYTLRRIYPKEAVRGRGAVYYRGEVMVNNAVEVVVIKDSWADVDARPTCARVTPKINADENLDNETKSLRSHTRILMEARGENIRMFDSLEGLLRALCDIVHAIRDVYEKGISHRDIGINDMLLYYHNGTLRGMLSDLDFAFSEGGHSATGALPFMAIDRLSDEPKHPYSYFHDLESVFYVMCWIGVMLGGPENERRPSFNVYRSALAEWGTCLEWDEWMTAETVYIAKMVSVKSEGDLKRTLKDLAPYFKPLEKIIRAFRKSLFDPVLYNSNVERKVEAKKDELDKKLHQVEASDKVTVASHVDLPVVGIKKQYLDIPIHMRPARLVFECFMEDLETAIRELSLARDDEEQKRC